MEQRRPPAPSRKDGPSLRGYADGWDFHAAAERGRRLRLHTVYDGRADVAEEILPKPLVLGLGVSCLCVGGFAMDLRRCIKGR